MAKDLLYRGLEAFAPEVDEEEKKKKEKKEPVIDDGTGKTLYEQHQQPENAPVNFLTEDSETSGSYKTPDGKFGLDVLDGAEEAPLMQPSSSITTDPTSNGQVSDPYHAPAPKEYRTVDEFFKDSGLSDIPELKGYTDERRVKRAGMQQNFYNLAQALRTVAQSAASNSGKGAYIDKFEQDRTTPRIQAELARVREANDAENRRVNLMNWQNKLKNADIKSRFIMNQENQERAKERQQLSLEAQDKRYEQQNKEWDRRYGNKSDPEFLEEIQKMETKYRKELLEAQTEEESKRITDKYDKMFEYNKKLYDEGIKNPTGSDKTVKTITRDGKKENLTAIQVEDLASGYLAEISQLPMEEQFKLDPRLQKILLDNKVPTAAQNRYIVGLMFPNSEEEPETGSLIKEKKTGSLLK